MSAEERSQRARHLMMAALDAELSGDERDELERLLDQDPQLREEWVRMNRVKEVTGSMRYVQPPEEVWGRYWVSVYNRLERGFGWTLISIGTIVLMAYGAWELVQALLADASVPGVIKVSIFAVVLGSLVLLMSVIREKLFTRRSDRYREVQR